MSYQIYYDKQFVRLGNQYIPMSLDGSNNCTETHNGYERRERNWNCRDYYFKSLGLGQFFATSEIIFSSLNQWIEKQVKSSLDSEYREPHEDADYIKKHWGYYTGESFGGGCSSLSLDQYLNWWKSGIKNAMTIEQLDNIGVHLEFSCFQWHSYSYSLPVPQTNIIKTEEQFYIELKVWQDWAKECLITEDAKTFHPSIYLHFAGHNSDYVTNALKRYRSQNRKVTVRPKIDVEQDHYFALYMENHGYLSKYTSRGFKYISYQSTSSKIFRTEKLAEKYRQDLIKKNRHLAQDWIVKKVELNNKITFKFAS